MEIRALTPFLLLTNNPGQLRTQLVNRGILQLVNGEYTGVIGGFEFLEVPNNLILTAAVTNPDGSITPAVSDTRRVFLCKFAHEMKADQEDGAPADDPDDADANFNRTKIVRWVKNKGTRDDLTLADGSTFRQWKFGTNHWISPDCGLLAVWQ